MSMKNEHLLDAIREANITLENTKEELEICQRSHNLKTLIIEQERARIDQLEKWIKKHGLKVPCPDRIVEGKSISIMEACRGSREENSLDTDQRSIEHHRERQEAYRALKEGK